MLTISLITVVYNRAATIERAIRSVLQQTYPHIEYIVVDGASTDGTLEILQRYRHRINTLVSEPDEGIYDALNKGIRLATGDVVGILHADDAFADERVLAEVAERFEQDPAPDCLYGDVGFVQEQQPHRIVRYFSSSIFHRGLFRYGIMPAHPTFFCYRKYFEKHGFYRTDLEIAADFDLLLRFLKTHQLRSAYLARMLVIMNMGGKSTRGINSTIKINREIKQVLKEHKIPSSYLHLYARYFIKVQEFWRKRTSAIRG
ncbi:MAG TPA: glycosyltransferase family 2 protein [Lacibacter sp.]|mgnify:FL=1|nr:glycosyltransferase family 2 protein [Lacibacter sp.]HMO88676.1 glycosyltransferase family 2 protein [Lacibacter sp.]